MIAYDGGPKAILGAFESFKKETGETLAVKKARASLVVSALAGAWK